MILAALKVDVIRCVSCGTELTVTEADLRIASVERDVGADEALVRACARHLMLDCERRYVGHPAFGAESRWNRFEHPNGVVTLEVGWASAAWGMPFLLYNVPGFKNGIVGHSDWKLD